MIQQMREKLGKEIEELSRELTVTLPQAIATAVAMGDLRENSEYKAALERQGFAQARVHHLRLRLSKLSDVSEKDIPKDRVGFGSRVTVQDGATKQREVYALTLGEFIEGDDAGTEVAISMASPLGKALLGRKVGETVDITLPMGKRKLKIVVLVTVHELAGKRDQVT